jgi:hypothetical protein
LKDLCILFFLGESRNITNKEIIKSNSTLTVDTDEISAEIGGSRDVIDKNLKYSPSKFF